MWHFYRRAGLCCCLAAQLVKELDVFVTIVWIGATTGGLPLQAVLPGLN